MKNDELIQKYKEIYKTRTEGDLPEDEAWSHALKLVRLVDAICSRKFISEYKNSKK